MDSRLVADLIIWLSRATHHEGAVEGLTPSQWGVLRYFGRANRFSRTPSAYAAFHGSTRGTASQAIKVLCEKGYLRQSRSRSDGRSRHLDLTDAGQAVLDKDPIAVLEHAIEALPAASRRDLASSLAKLGCELNRVAAQPLFGTCKDCVHLVAGGRCAAQAGELVTEPLRSDDLPKLCVYFEPSGAALRVRRRSGG